MPIQQIGGRNVYVITGTNTDPSKTSTGQSWANLVTQQKYMLFQEAQKQALQEMQRADADYQTQVDMVQKQRQALQREIDANRRTVQQLQSKQLTINDMRERQNQRESNKGMRTTTGGGGARGVTQTTANIADVQDHFENKINALSKQKQSLQREKAKIQSLKSEEEGKPYKNDAAIAQYTKRIRELNTEINNANITEDNYRGEFERMRNEEQSDPQAFKRSYNKLFGIQYKSGGTSAPAQTTQPVDVEETQLEPIEVDVSPYQERIKELETELGALEMPTRESVDLIPRQSEIYQQYFGRGAAPVDRSAEMDVLGVTPEEPVSVQPSPEVVVEPQPQPEPVVEEPVVEEPQPRTYTVQSGDTLSGVAQEMYGDASRYMDIAEASGVQDPDVIREGQQLTVPPSPTPTLPEEDRIGINKLRAIRLQPERFADIGRRMRMEDMMPEPVVKQQTLTIKDRFGQVTNQHPNQKKLLAMQLLQEYARELGVSSPEYAKAKKQVLKQLQQSLDPIKARQLKKIRKNQDEAPANYYNLGTMVSGVSDDSKRLVASLFPISDDTRVDEIESLYKNAQQQIRLSIKNKTQKRKALELLDLQYLAVLEDKR